MKNVRRIYVPGICYFFTVVTYKRRPILCSEYAINRLRNAFHYTKLKHPFKMPAIVILPDHLHCLWQLPENDSDFSKRWRIIKHYFSVGMSSETTVGKNKQIWQPRFWDHIIRNEKDLHRHLDYIHYNPVKHGYVKKPLDWPYSSFKRFVKEGAYETDWGEHPVSNIKEMEYE
ncbi:MAG: transposase [Gammaproteobacteria bacterium]|nr:transposase [Gammaproteobacteria bacterium]